MGSWFLTQNYFCTKSCSFSIQMNALWHLRFIIFWLIRSLIYRSNVLYNQQDLHPRFLHLILFPYFFVMQAYYYGISKWRMARSACMMLLSRFKMAQMWHQHTDDTNNLFCCFLTSGICTDRPQTHRAANDSIRKRILRWHSNKNNNKLIIILIVKQIFSCFVEDSDT